MKSTTLELEVKPQALDQSNRVKVKQSKEVIIILMGFKLKNNNLQVPIRGIFMRLKNS